MSENKRKGNVLEDLVALLHEFQGVEVERRVKLQTINANSKRRREIDVLLSTEVAGYPVKIAIECKNEKKKVGTQRIDSFIGMLKDVEIPVCNGIYVSAVGFTAPALERANSCGLRALVFEGLDANRLKTEVYHALQSDTYVVATWTKFSKFPFAPTANLPGKKVTLDPQKHGTGIIGILNTLWEAWVSKIIPLTLGDHVVSVIVPNESASVTEKQSTNSEVVIADLMVSGHVATHEGTAKRIALRHAQTQNLEKLRVDAGFPALTGGIELLHFNTEAELDAYLKAGEIHINRGRIRVPRIVHQNMFWPPGKEAVEKIIKLQASGKEITFEKVEGTDLSRAWEIFKHQND